MVIPKKSPNEYNSRCSSLLKVERRFYGKTINKFITHEMAVQIPHSQSYININYTLDKKL